MNIFMTVLAGIIITLVIIGAIVLGLLTMWDVDVSPMSWPLFWKISGSCVAVWTLILVVWVAINTFFKSEKGDKSIGNKAHPMN